MLNQPPKSPISNKCSHRLWRRRRTHNLNPGNYSQTLDSVSMSPEFSCLRYLSVQHQSSPRTRSSLSHRFLGSPPPLRLRYLRETKIQYRSSQKSRRMPAARLGLWCRGYQSCYWVKWDRHPTIPQYGSRSTCSSAKYRAGSALALRSLSLGKEAHSQIPRRRSD